MAHNITVNNGKAEMVYHGETPWHGLGTELANVATSDEVIKAVGWDQWHVQQEPISIVVNGQNVPVDGYLANTRSDNHAVLGVVSPKYKVIEYKDAIRDIDLIVGEAKAMYHTAGNLGQGEIAWVLAKLPADLCIGRDDLINQYLLLRTGHTGTDPLTVQFTPVRVVCQNTLSAAMRGVTNQAVISHRGEIDHKIVEARKILGLASRYYTGLGKLFNELVRKEMSKEQNVAVLDKVFPLPKAEEGAEPVKTTRTDNIRAAALHLIDCGKGLDVTGIRGTAWATYNGIVEYVDYVRSTKGTDDNARASNRLRSVWFGSGADVKSRTLEAVCEVAGVDAGASFLN